MKPETAARARVRIAEIMPNSPITMFLISRAPARSNRRFSISSMSPQPGEVWLADLGVAAAKNSRPVVIVSRQDPNPPRALVLYVPLTTQHRPSRYEVPLPPFPFLDRDSVANIQGLGSVPSVRLERRIGRLSNNVITSVKKALILHSILKTKPVDRRARLFLHLSRQRRSK